jgi:hypothetical protein
VSGFGLEINGELFNDPPIDGSNLFFHNPQIAKKHDLFNFAQHINDSAGLTLRRGIVPPQLEMERAFCR